MQAQEQLSVQLSRQTLSQKGFENLALQDAEIYYCANFLERSVADNTFEKLHSETPWQESTVKVFGKTHKVPRLSAFFGDAGLSYAYSGYSDSARPWIPTLLQLRELIKSQTQLAFNSVLLNLYRDGNDANGWHADNEPELGVNPIIASLSFGESRDFQLKHRNTKQRVDIELTAGSLLLMAGATQKNWLHCLPRRKRCVKPRINLTYRKIVDRVLK